MRYSEAQMNWRSTPFYRQMNVCLPEGLHCPHRNLGNRTSIV
jgi:hypothetical protein